MANVFSDQDLPFTLLITKADNTAAAVDGIPVYATSDATVLTVDAAADGMSGRVRTVANGTARVTVTVDADLGSGVLTITGVSEDVVVDTDPASMASALKIVFGVPVAKTPASGP